MMRSFEPEDAEFENSSRMLAELEGHVDVDHGMCAASWFWWVCMEGIGDY
jgi:hypothetical protein